MVWREGSGLTSNTWRECRITTGRRALDASVEQSSNVERVKASADLLAIVQSDLLALNLDALFPASRSIQEWHGPCVLCRGGNDRFLLKAETGMWTCRRCLDLRWKDPIEYVRLRDGVGFGDACRKLVAGPQLDEPRSIEARRLRPQTPQPSKEWRQAAGCAARHCQRLLWGKAGAEGRRWLHRRGLRDETLHHWGVGFSAGENVHGIGVPPGIVLPLWINGVLWQVKVRRLDDGYPKYTAATWLEASRAKAHPGGTPHLYGADELRGRRVALLTEGETDAMLVWQEAGDLVGAATLGSAHARVDARTVWFLLPICHLLLAYDLDEAGEKGAMLLSQVSPRFKRVRPPIPSGTTPKDGYDLTDAFQKGWSLRDWVRFHLAAVQRSTQFPGVVNHIEQPRIEIRTPAANTDPKEEHAAMVTDACTTFPASEIEDPAAWNRLCAVAKRHFPDDPGARIHELARVLAGMLSAAMNKGDSVLEARLRYCWRRLEEAERKWQSQPQDYNQEEATA